MLWSRVQISTTIGSVVLCVSAFPVLRRHRASLADHNVEVTDMGLGKPIFALSLAELQRILKVRTRRPATLPTRHS